MHGEDQYYPGVQLPAWNVTEDRLYHRYFLKLLTTSIQPIGQL